MADFGLQGIPSDPDEPDWLANAHRVLEPLPAVFSTVWISDHLQNHGKPWPGEAWTRLTYLSSTFPRLRFGHLVLCQSYRNPGLLGAMAATLQRLTGGRFILGRGAGWLEEEYRAFNFDFQSAGTRVAQLGEAIELIKTLWTSSPATYEGQWYRHERDETSDNRRRALLDVEAMQLRAMQSRLTADSDGSQDDGVSPQT